MLKLFICLVVVVAENNFSVKQAYKQLKTDMKPIEVLKVSLPALIYSIQNNILYFALSNLDGAVFQVLYQIKIFTTGNIHSRLYLVLSLRSFYILSQPSFLSFC